MNKKQAVFLGMVGLAVVSGVYAVHRDVSVASEKAEDCGLIEQVYDGDLRITRNYSDRGCDAVLESYSEHVNNNGRSGGLTSYDFNSGIKTVSPFWNGSKFQITKEESNSIHARYHSAFGHKIRDKI